MADHEITVDKALDPSATTDAAVKQMRENSVSLVCSDTSIGGIDAQIWRVEEGLPRTALGVHRIFLLIMHNHYSPCNHMYATG